MNSLDIILLRVVPNLTLRVEASRSSKVDKISSTADVNHFALRAAGPLASDDSSDWISGKGVSSVDGDVVPCAGGLDFFKVGKVADYDTVCVELGFGLGTADVGCDGPVWMGLLEGFCVGS
jgi:hypothetical protein